MNSLPPAKPARRDTSAESRPLHAAFAAAGVAAPLLSSVFFFAQVQAWEAAGRAAGADTADWGLAVIGVGYFWLGALVGAAAAIAGIRWAPQAIPRAVAVALITVVNIALIFLTLALDGFWSFGSVAMAASGVMLLAGTTGWLLRAWWVASGPSTGIVL